MTCSCIEGEWNFKIRALDVKTLEFRDLSKWNLRPPYVLPDKHTVTIIDPLDTSFDIEVNPQGSTIIKNTDLGQSGCLLDGIYCFSAYGCKNCENSSGDIKFTKTEFLGPQLMCKVQTEVVKGDTSYMTKFKQIEGSGKLGLTDQVRDLYSSLSGDLSMVNCSKCC